MVSCLSTEQIHKVTAACQHSGENGPRHQGTVKKLLEPGESWVWGGGCMGGVWVQSGYEMRLLILHVALMSTL